MRDIITVCGYILTIGHKKSRLPANKPGNLEKEKAMTSNRFATKGLPKSPGHAYSLFLTTTGSTCAKVPIAIKRGVVTCCFPRIQMLSWVVERIIIQRKIILY